MTTGFLIPLARFAKPHRRMLLAGMLFMLIESAVALAIPWFGGRFASDLLDGNRPKINMILALLGALFTAQALLRIHGGGFAWRDAEELGVELVDPVDEGAIARDHLARHVGIGIVELVERPEIGRAHV